MKKIFYILSAFVLVTLESCVMNVSTEEMVDEVKVAKITLQTKSQFTRSDAEDENVSSLRILIFDTSLSHRMAYNFYPDISIPGPITMTIAEGIYDFVFIANEESDAALNTRLNGFNKASDIYELDDEYFVSSAFDASKDIPMVRRFRNVKIESRDFLTIPVDNNQTDTIRGVWNVELERLAVRVDLNLTTGKEWFWNSVESIELINLPKKVYLFDTTSDDGTSVYNVFSGNDFSNTGLTLTDYDSRGLVSGSTSRWEWVKSRLIIPSSVFQEVTSSDKAIGVKVNMKATSPRYGKLGVKKPTDYTSPRNTYYKATGALVEEGIKFTINVEYWGNEQDVTIK